MCANADYREGFRVLAAELRRLMRNVGARWRCRTFTGISHAPNEVRTRSPLRDSHPSVFLLSHPRRCNCALAKRE
jgi:hypothetical protein